MPDLKPEIICIVAEFGQCDPADVTDESKLVGPDAIIDSLAVVEVLMAMEELATRNDAAFTWEDDPAMFAPDGPFATVGALSDHFHKMIGESQ